MCERNGGAITESQCVKEISQKNASHEIMLFLVKRREIKFRS
jgi:hypothetical protein